MVAIPVLSTSCLTTGPYDVCQRFIGVICLYPINDSLLPDIVDYAKQLAPILSEVYGNSVNYEQLRIRVRILNEAIPSNDLSSFSHRLVKLISSFLEYEGMSIFLLDERSKTLKLKGTTGVKRKIMENSIHFTNLMTVILLLKSLNSGRPEMIIHNHGDSCPSKYNERVKNRIVSTLTVPVFLPKLPHVEERQCIGFIRATNKHITHEKQMEAVSFWMGGPIFSFFCIKHSWGYVISLQ